MALVLVIIASLLSSVVNLMTKRNLDRVRTIKGYLFVYFIFSFFSCFLIDFKLFESQIHYPMFLMGGAIGAVIFFLMIFLAKALETGPPGLIFAFQNAASALPSILLFFLFGPSYGFMMNPLLITGLVAVLFGLYWGANPQFFYRLFNKSKETQLQKSTEKKWILYSIAAFTAQATILISFFWKSLLTLPNPPHPLLFNCSPSDGIWFLPGLFLSATILSAINFFPKEKRKLHTLEIFYGLTGGLLNGGATFLILLAAKLSTPAEKGILFPLNAIGVIIFCSIWGQKLYQEKVNWKAIFLCAFGVVLASI